MSLLKMVSTKAAPRQHPWSTVISAFVAMVVVIAGAMYVLSRPSPTRLTAYFGQAVGVYPGSDLRVLGVKVGRIDSVRPQGTRVRVTMTLDHGVSVPAGVDAVVVAPSIVADRYIQLSPAYTSGPKLGDHAVIPVTRTATPVELDQLYDSISRLAKALGPDGANKKGALSDVLDVGAANLAGNGKALGDMIDELSKASKTLSGNKTDLFSTLTNLQKFTTMLKNSDGQVRLAEEQLSSVNGFLADDRANLGGALKLLATALVEVKRFIHDNRKRLKSNVTKLASITQVLVDQRASLSEALDTIPLAAGNVLNAYDPVHQTLDGRGDLNEISMGGPITATSGGTADSQLCSVTGASSKQLAAMCRKYRLRPGDLTPVPSSRRDTLPPLPLPPVGQVYGSSEGGR